MLKTELEAYGLKGESAQKTKTWVCARNKFIKKKEIFVCLLI